MGLINWTVNEIFASYGTIPVVSPQDESVLKKTCLCLALSFGHGPVGQDGKPTSGRTNIHMAGLIERFMRAYGPEKGGAAKKLLAQWEIGILMPDELKATLIVDKSEKKQKNGEPEYLDTYEVIRQFYVYLQSVATKTDPDDESRLAQAVLSGQEPVVLIAHPDHWIRCARVCKAFGLKVIPGPWLDSIDFDRESVQKWTRNRKSFRRREILARLKYWWDGYTTPFADIEEHNKIVGWRQGTFVGSFLLLACLATFLTLLWFKKI